MDVCILKFYKLLFVYLIFNLLWRYLLEIVKWISICYVVVYDIVNKVE